MTRTLLYTYDKLGQLTAASDPAAVYLYVFDPGTRMTYESQSIAGLPSLLEYRSTYDGVGNRTSLKSTIGGTADFTNTYTYDNLWRLTSLVQAGTMQDDTLVGNAVAEKRIDFNYDAAGRFEQIARYADRVPFSTWPAPITATTPKAGCRSCGIRQMPRMPATRIPTWLTTSTRTTWPAGS